MGLWGIITYFIRKGRFFRLVCLFLVGLIVTFMLTSCRVSSTQNSNQNSNVELTFVSFAVTRPAYKKIIPQFIKEWKQQHNQTVRFNESYAASGAQTRAVIDGLDTDVVGLALALDMKKIQQAGLIEPGWEKKAPNNSIVTQSVAVLVTREDNPKQINNWGDLTREDVSIVTPNPKTSGVARWNFLALWGSQKYTSQTDTEALDFTTKVYKNVSILPRDAREASDVFLNQGQGDVLVNYENEIILAGLRGKKRPYIVPSVNISIDNPIAVVDRNVEKHGNREIAEAFVQYLFTPPAQREFAKIGFRPVESSVKKEFIKKYPPVKDLFTVTDLGGWDRAQKQFFANGAAFDQIQANIR
ncbi:MAG: sulfate ABC transporter substrate-binding protein [Cyanobacteria bacterium P01_A01_bin.84]